MELDDLRARELPLDWSAEAHDVQNPGRGPEQGAYREPGIRIGCLVVRAIAPADFEVIGAGEIAARGPGTFGHVGGPYGDACMQAVPHGMDRALDPGLDRRRSGNRRHGRRACRHERGGERQQENRGGPRPPGARSHALGCGSERDGGLTGKPSQQQPRVEIVFHAAVCHAKCAQRLKCPDWPDSLAVAVLPRVIGPQRRGPPAAHADREYRIRHDAGDEQRAAPHGHCSRHECGSAAL